MPIKKVSGSIIVNENNGSTHTINAKDLDFQEVERDSRQMGDEITHAAEVELSKNCTVEIEVWEYPEGAYNADEINVTNGSYEGGFSYDIAH